MAPKKAQKMSLNAFLEDSSLGSWADEMDALPTAPAPRTDEERANDRSFGGRGDRDFLSSRPDRVAGPPREEIPLPTQPPYTAFIGNLAFDLTESELEAFFAPHKTVSVKIIKDREDKPKGFGYVEFADLDGLKAGLAKSGANFSSRTIRVSVAEPQKERAGGFGSNDDDKFASNWRRDGPLPDRNDGRDGGRPGRRFEGGAPSDAAPSASETVNDWRSSRGPPKFPTEAEPPANRRRGSGFSTPEGQASAADQEETWTIGAKFKPSAGGEAERGGRFGSMGRKGDMGPPPPALGEDSDWRSSSRPRPSTWSSNSPTSSVPSTPQMSRRKLELLPRSTAASAQPTPVSSPKSPAFTGSTIRPNPFGAAKPVDVSARENEVLQKLEKDREEIKERVTHSMSRQSSKQARERPSAVSSDGAKTPPSASAPPASPPPAPGSPRASASTVRPAFSFAKAASAKKESITEAKVVEATEGKEEKEETSLENVTKQVAEVTV
ncbi:hypothetical protein BD410DRAFT_784469 [Rickenella mellea]|uniref:RRM domain-containing protein n=1 Tax=Rickenella mellea TaxID=50990 RepID=A0A4Y7QF46_9AGAM|nr:hypothetical protein BD410DRAFT_784469 [Rickenella mellea]